MDPHALWTLQCDGNLPANMKLKDIKQEYGNVVLCYVDDILIATTTVEQHLEKLDQVFQ